MPFSWCYYDSFRWIFFSRFLRHLKRYIFFFGLLILRSYGGGGGGSYTNFIDFHGFFFFLSFFFRLCVGCWFGVFALFAKMKEDEPEQQKKTFAFSEWEMNPKKKTKRISNGDGEYEYCANWMIRESGLELRHHDNNVAAIRFSRTGYGFGIVT